MRIIGGSLGGRRLRAPRGDATRPTADRVRESLFNILGPPPAETRVLDLCAGAGSLGLEALSRGAAYALFVDDSRAAVRCLRDNIAALQVESTSAVQFGDVRRVVGRLGDENRFHWVFADPPYRTNLAAEILALLAISPAMADDVIVAIEHDRRNEPAPLAGCLVRTDRRRYGDTVISFYRRGTR